MYNLFNLLESKCEILLGKQVCLKLIFIYSFLKDYVKDVFVFVFIRERDFKGLKFYVNFCMCIYMYKIVCVKCIFLEKVFIVFIREVCFIYKDKI